MTSMSMPSAEDATASNICVRHSLETKVTLSITIIFLLSIWVLATYNSRLLGENYLRASGLQQLSAASLVAETINQHLEDRLEALESVAQGITAPVLSNPVAIEALLAQRPALQNHFNAGTFVTRTDGIAIADFPRMAKRIGLNVMERDFMIAALKEGKSSVGSPIFGKIKLGVPILSMASPIRDARGEVIGALVGVTDLSRPNIFDKITGVPYGETGGYVLIDPRQRRVITATDRSRIMQALPLPGSNPQLDRFVDGSQQGPAMLINPLGKEVQAVAARIPVNGWCLVVALPSEELYPPMHNIQARHITIVTMLTLLLGFLLWWLLNRQFEPARNAARTLAAMANNQLPMQTLPNTSQGEIGVLVEGFNRMLTKLEQSQKAVEESELRWKFAIEGSRDGVWDWNIPEGIVFYSSQWKEMLGFGEDEIGNGLNEWEKRIHPDDKTGTLALVQACLDGVSRFYVSEHRVLAKNGGYIWLSDRGLVVKRSETGQPLRMIGTHSDISERKQREQEFVKYREHLEERVVEKTLALQEEKGFFEDLVNTQPFGVYRIRTKALTEGSVWSADEMPPFQLDIVSDSLCQLLGITSAEVEAKRREGINTRSLIDKKIHPDDLYEFRRIRNEAISAVCDFSWQGRMKLNGGVRWIQIDASPRSVGEEVAWTAVFQDITERRQQNSLIYRSVIEASTDAFIAIDESDQILEWSPQAERLFGYSLSEVRGKSLTQTIIPQASAGDHIRHMRDFLAAGHNGVIGKRRRLQALRSDSSEITVEMQIMALKIGEHWRFTSFIRDITVELNIEQQLAQAQKLEAIGHLTGGLAHDFNNILGIVIGNLDFLSQDIPDGEPRELIDAAMAAAQRGADVTKALLALARRRNLVPKEVDINQLILQAEPLLRQTAGKRVKFTLQFDDEHACTTIDAGSFCNALLNIVINACDAMPDGGDLLVYVYSMAVERGNTEFPLLEPGTYVVVGVDDSGTGMTPEVARQAFDPFFTTKGRSKGTGLGLAMVLSFARQSGGTARISSTPGRGSSVQILLPAKPSANRMEHSQPNCNAPQCDVTFGGERVLVVDDEVGLLQVCARWLRNLGYKVETSMAAQPAIDRLERERFDLMITDVVMPGKMDGIALAHHAASRYPSMRILLASGFPENLSEEARTRWTLLEKPIAQSALAEAVAVALGRKPYQENGT